MLKLVFAQKQANTKLLVKQSLRQKIRKDAKQSAKSNKTEVYGRGEAITTKQTATNAKQH